MKESPNAARAPIAAVATAITAGLRVQGRGAIREVHVQAVRDNVLVAPDPAVLPDPVAAAPAAIVLVVLAPAVTGVRVRAVQEGLEDLDARMIAARGVMIADFVATTGAMTNLRSSPRQCALIFCRNRQPS
jgi:hypothetical protein